MASDYWKKLAKKERHDRFAMKSLSRQGQIERKGNGNDKACDGQAEI